MTFSLEWVGDRQILYCRLEGTLALAELRIVNTEISHLVTGAPGVHLVCHLAGVDHPLPSVNALRSALVVRGHERMGWMLLVGGSASARFVGTIVTGTLGLRMHSLISVEDAVEFLRVRDPLLSPDSLNELRRCAFMPSEPVLPIQ